MFASVIFYSENLYNGNVSTTVRHESVVNDMQNLNVTFISSFGFGSCQILKGSWKSNCEMNEPSVTMMKGKFHIYKELRTYLQF